ncbi:MAG TPA: sugar ABC transporter ATP-binding protein [Burkholderiaceae bacterium]
MTTAAPVVSIRGLSKAFSGVRVLDQVGFELRPGEVHALMGENGAGKSTLMKILAGVHRADAGEIRIREQPVQIADPRAAQALGIAMIHQELNLMNHLTAAQNIFIGREPRGRLGLFLDEAALNHNARRIFERMKLRFDPRALVGELSVAQQQMVEIAKALSFEQSRVLIMDEPTAALNGAEVAELFRLTRQLKEQGVGIVYISHKMDELRRIADRVTVMRDGHPVATLPMATTSVDTIISMMVGRELAEVASEAPDTANNEVMLEVRRLNRGKAVRDAGFVLRRGEILGFAGLMGAGRTELARAVFGADEIDSGEIRVRGREVVIRSPADAVAHGIGYLSEDRKHFGLATALDVEANVLMASLASFSGAIGVIKPAAMRAEAARLVERLQIKTPSLDQPVALLSGGNQQKVVIAKWLLRDCEILIFDEPTRGIDVGAKAEIYKLLNQLAAQGKAIVVISSELPEVLRLAHRILVMCEGRITGELAAHEATQEKIMQLATRHETALIE